MYVVIMTVMLVIVSLYMDFILYVDDVVVLLYHLALEIAGLHPLVSV